jgi:Alginate export
MRIFRQTGRTCLIAFCSAAAIAAGLLLAVGPAQAAFELPEGEKITHAAVVARAIPDKEAYELYDPKIGKNFDISKFWMRADLRVRYEMRNNTCFGSAMATTAAAPLGNGACNTPNSGTTPNGTAGKANESYALQKARLGFGYDISPDVNFYLELIYSSVWGANGSQGTPLNDNQRTNSGSTANGFGNGGVLGVRAGYMLIRNFAGIQDLSVKAGRQYVVFGSHSIFGAFDWSNTGFAFDGIMLQYSTKAWESYAGWFRVSESDLGQGSPLGALTTNLPVQGSSNPSLNNGSANIDSDVFLFYNQIKSVPGFVIEPYYILYSNRYNSGDNRSQGLGTPKHSNQTRHMVGSRIEMRKGNFDGYNETIYQFGQMGDDGGPSSGYGNQKYLHINAWATRTWIGYTHYEWDWKPRLAFNFDYSSGDGRSNCTIGGNTDCKTANTFENLWGTNHIHMGYMDTIAWKNMMKPSINLQFRPTKNDHIEIWATSLNLANTKDNWYRAAQGVYVYSKTDNNKRHLGNELDIIWTRFFMEGKLSFQAGYGHLFAGDYIQENLGTSTDQDWAYAQLWMNF